ncbi:hypothetical protein C8J57DRAFT_1317343 [Mycena rebaudengoi]|nr:hypothetical protein C8J57DRAFT_1317343 [Mycena rebaudengoi]
MRLPLDMIDEIIGQIFEVDEDDLYSGFVRSSQAFSCQDQDSLKSCTLVSRVVRPLAQQRLFMPSDWTTSCRSDFLTFADIALSLPQLRKLDLHPSLRMYPWSAHPVHFRTALITAFSLPGLRSLQLNLFKFADAVQLHSVLRSAVGLKDLTLIGVSFTDTSSHIPAVTVPGKAGVVLDSLCLLSLGTGVVESLLSAFTAVNIRQLRCLEFLDIMDIETTKLLFSANAHSLETIKLQSYIIPTAADVDIFAGENKVRLIELNSPGLSLLLLFGNLENLKVLKTVRLTPIWRSLDARLFQLEMLEEVMVDPWYNRRQQIVDSESVDTVDVMHWMPLLMDKGILRIIN